LTVIGRDIKKEGQRVRVINGADRGKVGTFTEVVSMPISSIQGIDIETPKTLNWFRVDLDEGGSELFKEEDLEVIEGLPRGR